MILYTTKIPLETGTWLMGGDEDGDLLESSYVEVNVTNISEEADGNRRVYYRCNLYTGRKNGKGKAIYGMRIATLCMLADFFGTSTDYILARSPIRTSDPDTQIAVRTTGLSEEAIEKISTMDEKQLHVLDMMIKSEHLDKMLKFISSGAEFLGFEEAIIIDKVFSGIKGQEHISALTMDLYSAIKAGFSFRSFFTGEAEKEASSMIREIATELYDKLENSNQVD